MTDIDDEGEGVTEFLDPLLVRAKTRLGQTLSNKWRLDVLLGFGGMAAVYAATHRNGSRAAVKVLHAELSANADVLNRFMREGYAANTVAHEGVVKVLDDDVSSDGSFYLVTELLDGETLDERRIRSGGRLGEDEVLSVADLLLDVVAAAHAKGVIHRDIKPANVFLTRLGQLKVLDFGIAHLRELSSATVATKSGAALGTPAFMSPEQARGLWSEVDGRSDIFSVGATMWEALTGRLVHLGRTPNEELLSAMSTPAPSIATVLPTLSPTVARVIDRALAFEKEQRWLDARRMQEGVRRAYYDRNGSEITTAPRITVPETVPNRTIGTTGAAREVAGSGVPTTARPVARTPYGAMFLAPSRRVAVGLAVAGTVSVVAVAATIPRARRPDASPTIAAVPMNAGASMPTLATAPPSAASVWNTVVVAPLATTLAAPDESATSSSPSPATAGSTQPAPTDPRPAVEVTARPVVAPLETAAPLASAAKVAPVAAVLVEAPKPTKPADGSVASAPTASSSIDRAPSEALLPQEAAKPDCAVPYVIDPATGKKHFKVECL